MSLCVVHTVRVTNSVNVVAAIDAVVGTACWFCCFCHSSSRSTYFLLVVMRTIGMIVNRTGTLNVIKVEVQRNLKIKLVIEMKSEIQINTKILVKIELNMTFRLNSISKLRS